jgi:hypothetical protein
MPLPNGRVISATWSQHHRPTATGTMTAECVITRRDPAGVSDGSGDWTPSGPTTVYTGPCRVQVMATQQQVIVVGETQETQRRYLVTVKFDTAELHVHDLVTITASVDAGLVGRELRVGEVAYGSEQWERDLTCEEMGD